MLFLSISRSGQTVLLLFAFICGPGGDWAQEKDRQHWRYDSPALYSSFRSMSASQLSGFSLLFCKTTKPSTQNRSTNQNAGDHKASANFHVFLGCGWPQLSAHHSWIAEENNYKEGQRRLHDLNWARGVITPVLCHAGNLLSRDYSRCNFKGSRDFRGGQLRSSAQKKTLFFAFVVLMRELEMDRERERENQKQKTGSVLFLLLSGGYKMTDPGIKSPLHSSLCQMKSTATKMK